MAKRKAKTEKKRKMRWRPAAAPIFALLFSLFALILPACETKVVHYHPFLAGLPDVETQTPTTGPRGEYFDPTLVPGNRIIEKQPDGTAKLTAKTGQHLMVHIFNCLSTNDAGTFTEQVLSEMTKQEYYGRGLDPRGAFDAIKARQADVVRLFRAMPAGESTPDVISRNLGAGVRRFQATGKAAQGLTWTGIDMVMEKGNWKLRWFVGE